MRERLCGLCDRPLRNRKWWNNWLLGPYCNGRDLEECKHLYLVKCYARLLKERNDDA